MGDYRLFRNARAREVMAAHCPRLGCGQVCESSRLRNGRTNSGLPVLSVAVALYVDADDRRLVPLSDRSPPRRPPVIARAPREATQEILRGDHEPALAVDRTGAVDARIRRRGRTVRNADEAQLDRTNGSHAAEARQIFDGGS
jgi:hypothetical protein